MIENFDHYRSFSIMIDRPQFSMIDITPIVLEDQGLLRIERKS